MIFISVKTMSHVQSVEKRNLKMIKIFIIANTDDENMWKMMMEDNLEYDCDW